ncbi:MAG: OmpA/MotB family protein, partial [Acidimicrobiales bacterium]
VSQEWLASYADAMTLLLAFFIMMFAFALIDEGKYFDFKVGVMAALGVPDPLTDNTDSILEKGTGISPEVGLSPISPSEEAAAAEEELREALAAAGLVTPENAEELKELLEQEFFYAGAQDFVEVGIDERGVFIRFDGRVLFDSGQTALDDNGLTLLATAADVLQIVDNPLEVEGHTDSQPTNGTTWPSNWELSAARASRVVRWMIEPGGLPPTRLTAVGLADTRPTANNNTATGRQENRRVEIVTRIVQTASSAPDAEATDPGTEAPTADGPANGDETTENEDLTGAGETAGGGDPADGVEVLDPGEPGDEADPSGQDPVDLADDATTLEDVTTIDPIGDPIGLTPSAGPDAPAVEDGP